MVEELKKRTYLADEVKASMGITSDDFDNEIRTMIEACFIELELAGVKTPLPQPVRGTPSVDPLTLQALVYYCKAYMRMDANSPNYMKAFEHLKDAMSLSAEYRRDLSEESGNV